MLYKHKNYCPVCGKPTFSAISFKEFVCSNCRFTYFQNVAAASALIIEYMDCVLLTLRKHDPAKGMLDLPGGFIDPHESVEDGLRREIKEELNIEIEEMDYLFSLPNEYLYKEVKYYTLDFFFTTKIRSMDPIKPADDVADYRLVKKKEINYNDIGLSSIKEAMRLYTQM